MNAIYIEQPHPASGYPGPFDLSDGRAYGRWRERKLAARARRPDELVVELADAARPTPAEVAALREKCRRCNMAIYRSRTPLDKAGVRALGRALGLERLDGNLCADGERITALQVNQAGRHRHYIPYTDKPLNWHTDGYYNRPEQRIRAMVLHCVRPAAAGGASGLLDHELVYIRLRDESPDLVAALMQPDALVIPPNTAEGEPLRGAQAGPVFSVDPHTGWLHMRYSARTRNVIWKDDPLVRQAAARLRELVVEEARDALAYRLQAGEGVVANNVLHRRDGFEDGPGGGRLLYRARYYDRIDGTVPTGTEG